MGSRLRARSLRLWANPARTSSKKRCSCKALSKFLREIFSMSKMAESTFGGGEKAPAGTVRTYLGEPYALTESDKILSFGLGMRLALSEVEGAMRSATSFWTKK